MRHPSREAWPYVALPLLALAIRLRSLPQLLGPGGFSWVVDTDTHYHVLRAMRIVAEFPRVPLWDPRMNFPAGAKILWPPLFDYLIALPALLAGGSPTVLAWSAAVVSPVLGAATVLLVMRLAALVGGRATAILAGLLLAFCPEHLTITVAARPDQHSAELFLYAWVMLSYFRILRPRPGASRWGTPLAMGVGLALAFWNWQGSALCLLVPAVFAGLWHAFSPAGSPRIAARALATGAGAGAVILAGSLALVLPGELLRLEGKGVTGFQVLLLAGAAGLGALLDLASRRWPGAGVLARVSQVAGAAAVAGGLTFLLGASGIRTNLLALWAGNRWYQTINEFWPIFFAGPSALTRDVEFVLASYGLYLFAMPFAAVSLVRLWRRDPASRDLVALLLTWGVLLLAMTIFRRRLGQYLVVPMVLWLAVALDDLRGVLDRLDRWGPAWVRGAVPYALVALLVAPAYETLAATPPVADPQGDVRAALTFVRGEPVRPGRESVLSDWKSGHLVQYVAGRPVLTTPFGVDGGAGAMEDAARFYLATDEQAAEEVLARRRVGFVLLPHPGNEVYVLSDFTSVPEPQPVGVVNDWSRGELHEIRPSFFGLIPSRLYFADGSEAGQSPALGGFRLVYEGRPSGREPLNEKRHKLFEVVPGAVLAVRGAEPGRLVAAKVLVETNQGRRFEWSTRAISDADGAAELRVPYASDRNGLGRAGPYRVGSGDVSELVSVGEVDVVDGGRVEVSLPRAAPRPRR